MADSQSNAPSRAHAGTPTSGVIHVRTRLTADFTVISNGLAQRRGSAVTIGVAAYIASLPDGSPVTITASCEHFSEGEILISRALRELEAAGYLERRRERTPTGQVRTRTYFYAVPRGEGPEDPPEPPEPRSRKRSTVPETRREAASAPAPEEPGSPAPALTDADPEAVAVLTALRRVDPRLVLSGQEAARLAPAVTEWLAAGVGPREITELLTVRLPDRFRARRQASWPSASGKPRCRCRPLHHSRRASSARPYCPSRPATTASGPSAPRSPDTAGAAGTVSVRNTCVRPAERVDGHAVRRHRGLGNGPAETYVRYCRRRLSPTDLIAVRRAR